MKAKKHPKIIQILIGPENQKWQGKLIGLADDGRVFYDDSGYWCDMRIDWVKTEKQP